MDYVNEHIRKHLKVALVTEYGTYYAHTPRFKCADGYDVSIQARDGSYCTPRINAADHYTAVELGYPNQYDEMLDEWCEDPSRPTDTVYPYVPVEVVNALIEKHGGPMTQVFAYHDFNTVQFCIDANGQDLRCIREMDVHKIMQGEGADIAVGFNYDGIHEIYVDWASLGEYDRDDLKQEMLEARIREVGKDLGEVVEVEYDPDLLPLPVEPLN